MDLGLKKHLLSLFFSVRALDHTSPCKSASQSQNRADISLIKALVGK